MGTEARLWQALTILVMLITATVPAYVAYDLFSKGPAPEKRVELTQFAPIDPMRDLSILGDKVTLSLRIEDEALNNLVIAKASLQNVGTTPILPTDYHQNISVSVQRPWKIVAVENATDFPRNVEFKWKRVSDTRFEAEPALRNPQDRASTHVYLTNTKFDVMSDPLQRTVVYVEWKARITNLLDFVAPPLNYMEDSPDIAVLLSGWALLFTIAVAMLFQALYLHLLWRSGLLNVIAPRAVFLVVGASFLSFAAAESISTYLFGNYLTRTGGVPHWMNVPWIILHVALLLVLYKRAQSYSTEAARPLGTGLQGGS